MDYPIKVFYIKRSSSSTKAFLLVLNSRNRRSQTTNYNRTIRLHFSQILYSNLVVLISPLNMSNILFFKGNIQSNELDK